MELLGDCPKPFVFWNRDLRDLGLRVTSR